MKRETGYYWVKRNREWFIAEWRQYTFEEFEDDARAWWWFDTHERSYEEGELEEINEARIKNPDEK